MSIADPIGDMITRIRNGQMRLSSTVMIPASKFRTKVLDVLRSEGYISNYKLLVDENNISVNLKYNQGIPVIREITRVSKPGRRIYTRADSIPRIQNGLGIAIMSTSKGVMTDNDARKENLGGEILCKVF
tara:strand:+ start:1012 stop:1401 length:390 start_codon:yes stop_codon:yes gene_type:complete